MAQGLHLMAIMMKRLAVSFAMLSTISAALAQEAPVIPVSFQAYQNCVQDAAKGHTIDLLKLRPLDKIRQDTLTQIDKCDNLLPPEAQPDKEQLKSTVILMTQPTPRSGVEKGPTSATAGVILQTKTGASLVLSTDTNIDLPKQSIFSLTEGYKLRAAGIVAIGSTASGASTIPVAKLTLQAGRALDVTVSDDQKKALDQFKLDLAGFNAASIREIVGVTFDRNTAMDRPWDVGAGYGREISVTGENRGLALRATLEGGVGQSGSKTLPYLRLMVGVDGYICTPLHGEKHLFCVSSQLAAGAGPVQAKFDVNVAADYRYVAGDRNDTKKWFHSVSVGPSFHEELQGDLAGGHAASQGMFSITIN